jgi:hypothetical protein
MPQCYSAQQDNDLTRFTSSDMEWSPSPDQGPLQWDDSSADTSGLNETMFTCSLTANEPCSTEHWQAHLGAISTELQRRYSGQQDNNLTHSSSPEMGWIPTAVSGSIPSVGRMFHASGGPDHGANDSQPLNTQWSARALASTTQRNRGQSTVCTTPTLGSLWHEDSICTQNCTSTQLGS